METKLILVLILHICLGQWNKCSDDKERQSMEEIRKCFLDNASLDPCSDHICSENGVCSSSNLDNDVACLIDYCQRKCKSKEQPCVFECLNLDSCNKRETEEKYMDCIRNSTVNTEAKHRLPDLRYGYRRPRYDPWTSTSYREGGITMSPETAMIVVPLVLICSICILVGYFVWYCFAGGHIRGGVSTVGGKTTVNPGPNPQGAYPAQNIPMVAPGPSTQQIPGPTPQPSPGPEMTPYPVENPFEPQAEATKRGKLPELPEQKSIKVKKP